MSSFSYAIDDNEDEVRGGGLRLKLVFVALFGVLGWAYWYTRAQDKNDLSFVPDHSNVLLRVNWREFSETPIGRPLSESLSRSVDKQKGQATAEFLNELESQIDRITIGARVPKFDFTPEGSAWSGVVRLREPVAIPDAWKNSERIRHERCEGRQVIVFRGDGQDVAACCMFDDRTVLIGTSETVRAVLARRIKPANLPAAIREGWETKGRHSDLALYAEIPSTYHQELPAVLRDAQPSTLVAAANGGESFQLDLRLNLAATFDSEKLLREMRGVARMLQAQLPEQQEIELDVEGQQLIAVVRAPWQHEPGQPKFISSQRSAQEFCNESRRELQAAVRRFHQHTGAWPASPHDVYRQFSNQSIPTVCPVDGTPYELDDSHRVKEHRH